MHKAKGEAHEAKIKAEREARRTLRKGNSSERGYGYRWQNLRKSFLREHPLCVECAKKGLTTVATDVDHIVPHKGDQSLMWDWDNLQPLCHSCHSKKTAREDGGFGNG